MGSLEMTCLDLECGSSAVSINVKDESICVSKATKGYCSSQSYSATDSSNQGQTSSVVATDCVVDIDQNGVDEVRISVEKIERECRICMLSLDSEPGSAIELGCSCKNELAAVHQHCAETWFASKGNRICEICKSIAQNVVVPNSTRSSQRILEVNRSLTTAVRVLLPEHSTISRNTITVPVSAHNAPSTNAALFQEVEVITISRSSDLAPISSTSISRSSDLAPISSTSISRSSDLAPISSTSVCNWVCELCENLLMCALIGFALFFIDPSIMDFFGNF